MKECHHQLLPIVYGYMDGEMISQLDSHEVMYGGMTKSSGSADWLCIDCLKEVFI